MRDAVMSGRCNLSFLPVVLMIKHFNFESEGFLLFFSLDLTPASVGFTALDHDWSGS